MSITDAALATCITCHARPVAYMGTWMCGGCYARMRGNLAAVARAHRWIGIVMSQIGPGWRTGTIHGSEKSRPPMRLELHDQRELILKSLRTWAGRICVEYPGGLAGPADGSLEQTVPWLRERLPWCSEQHWVWELAGALRTLRSESNAIAPWEGVCRRLPTPCGECGRLTLAHYAEDDAATCRNRACGVVYPWPAYEALVYVWCDRVTLQARRRRAQKPATEADRRLAAALDPDDVDDPATIYLTTDQAAAAAHVESSTVRSWATRGQLRPYYYDGDDTPHYLESEVLDLEASTRRGRHQLSLLGEALASINQRGYLPA